MFASLSDIRASRRVSLTVIIAKTRRRSSGASSARCCSGWWIDDRVRAGLGRPSGCHCVRGVPPQVTGTRVRRPDMASVY